MSFLYTLSILFYARVIWLASLFNPKAKLWWEGRKEKTWANHDFDGSEWIWFHCASLGEFDMGLPLMKAIKDKKPELKIIVTFFSPSGMQFYNKRKHCVDFACYLPIDLPSNATEFLNKVNPKSAFFVKYEFWHHFIHRCKQNGIPVYSVSSIFRENQMFFKPYGGFFRKTLRHFDYFFVQNESSVKLLNSISIHSAEFVGDLRFDRVIENAKACSPDETLKKFVGQDAIWIIGSSWPEDEEVLFHSINTRKEYKIIIAPHDISEAHVEKIEKYMKRPFVRFSQLASNSELNSEVLILDTIGHLMNAYSLAQIAYVGGGFKGSLHNILEPIAFHVPVIFGPKHSKFPEAQSFMTEGIGIEISNQKDLELAIEKLQKNLPEIKSKIEVFLSKQDNIASKIVARLKL